MQPDLVCKPRQVKVAKGFAVAFIDAIAEAVCEERVACEPLDFLDEEVEQLRRNRDWLVETLPEKIPGIRFEVPAATYLMFLDFSGTKLDSAHPAAYLRTHAKVALNEGASFGPGGEHKARLNFATSPEILREAVDRIATAIDDISR